MTEPPDNAIDLLREWLKEWDDFLRSDEREVIPDVWPQHLDALEKVINVSAVADTLFTPKLGEFRSMNLRQVQQIKALGDAILEMRRG